MDEAVVIGVVMLSVQMLKARGMSKQVVPLTVLILAAALNLVNARVFSPDMPWEVALKEGLLLGALSSGVYGLGKAALGRS